MAVKNLGFTGVTPNNSFKPNLLRYTKAMAEKACHGFVSTTQVGLTQVLGAMRRLLLLPLLMLAGCSGGPNEAQRRADFMTLRPGCTLIASDPGDGDSDNVWVEFTYQCGTASQPLKTEALYERRGRTWTLNGKTQPSDPSGSAGT